MTDAQKESLTKLVEYYRLAQWDEVTLTADHADAIDAALAKIAQLRAAQAALLVAIAQDEASWSYALNEMSDAQGEAFSALFTLLGTP